MPNPPLFSIIIPIYKTELYLDRCVQSARRQSFSHIEIILVDDGSPDGCPAMCDAYAREDARVKVIHKPNGGLSDARNAGMEAATGDYLLFLDSDDYLEPDACERLNPAAATGRDILIGTWLQGAEASAPPATADTLVSEPARAYLWRVLSAGRMRMAAVLYVLNRRFTEQHSLRFKVGICHEDDEFTPRAFLAADTVAVTNVAFYRYILREDSITTRRDMRRNDTDHHATCVALEEVYRALPDKTLARLLLDTLAMQTLSLFQSGRLYQYGSMYIHRKTVLRCARRFRTRLKALLYCISPRLYWRVNHISKTM